MALCFDHLARARSAALAVTFQDWKLPEDGDLRKVFQREVSLVEGVIGTTDHANTAQRIAGCLQQSWGGAWAPYQYDNIVQLEPNSDLGNDISDPEHVSCMDQDIDALKCEPRLTVLGPEGSGWYDVVKAASKIAWTSQGNQLVSRAYDFEPIPRFHTDNSHLFEHPDVVRFWSQWYLFAVTMAVPLPKSEVLKRSWLSLMKDIYEIYDCIIGIQ